MFARILTLLLLLVGGSSLRMVFVQAPALNPERREEAVDANWRVPVARALYDPADYAYYRGYMHLLSAPWPTSGNPTPPMVVAARPELARDLFQKGLAVAPADAFLWAGIAWAEASLGNADPSLVALMRSFTSAPVNAALAADRLMLLELLGQTKGTEVINRFGGHPICSNLQLAVNHGEADHAKLQEMAPTIVASCNLGMVQDDEHSSTVQLFRRPVINAPPP